MQLSEYTRYDAIGLAELVRRREVSPTELVDTALSAIEKTNPTLNAVVSELHERGRAAAEGPLPEGPLAGVPFLLKDNLDLEGTVASWGAFLGLDNHAKHSHEIARRIEQAGLLVLGRTNMSELGFSPVTESALFGATANPWSLERSPGGSSGGSAAAVAAGMVPMAHGADGGGSIRIPASACGLFGLKISRGRQPAAYHDDPDGFTVQGALSRTVRDSAAFVDAIRGARPIDRWQLACPDTPYLQIASEDPAPLKIAFTATHLDGGSVHPECATAVQDAMHLCEGLGHTIEERRPELDFLSWAEGFGILWAMGAGFFMESVRQTLQQERLPRALAPLANSDRILDAVLWLHGLSARRAPLEPLTRTLIRINRQLTPAHHWVAWQQMSAAGGALADFLTDFDLLALPVLGDLPIPTGSFVPPRNLEEATEGVLRYAGLTPICNTSGLPAMSVPLHMSAGGLPVGVQFIAPHGREDRLFALAGQLERAQPWKDRRPPHHVDAV